MTKIRPLFDRLYVERTETELKTQGGLYIPEGSKEKGQTGKVVATGTKADFQVKVGDVVFLASTQVLMLMKNISF
ncbi:MAG: hypothetical protein LVQ75_01920 [Candidatus Babeliales bacterium]|jgi:co-chaperonin GroES (HSP10)